MSKDRTSLTVSSDLLQDIRREKSFLTLEVNEEIANEDAISFLIVERVLGTKTVFDLVKGINDIREHKEEKFGFSEAIREVAELLRAEPSRRKSMIDDLDEDYAVLVDEFRKLPEPARDVSLEEMESREKRFAEILSKVEDLPKNPLIEEYRSDFEEEDSSSRGEEGWISLGKDEE